MINKEQFIKIYGKNKKFDFTYWLDLKIYQKFYGLYMQSIGIGLSVYFLETPPPYKILTDLAEKPINGYEYLMYQVVDYFCSLADNKRITEKNDLAEKLIPKYKLVKYSSMNMKEIADRLTERMDNIVLNRVFLSNINVKFNNENEFIPKYRYGVGI